MSAPEELPEDRWVDEHAGPVVRPYAMTRGRTRPVTGRFDLVSLVTATHLLPTRDLGLGPEHLAIVRLCHRPLSVAELAAYLDLPLGTIRVMLGDLLERGLVLVREPAAAGALPHISIIEAAIDGLRAL